MLLIYGKWRCHFSEIWVLGQVGGNMESAQSAVTGSNSDALVASLSGFRKYLDMAGIFYQAFQIDENRGVLWWSLHRLLEQPRDGVTFGELLDHLTSVSGSTYSEHVVCQSLVAMQEKGYLSLAHPSTGEKEDRPGDEGKLSCDPLLPAAKVDAPAHTSIGVMPNIKRIKKGAIVRLEPKIYMAISSYAILFKKTIVKEHVTISTDDILLYKSVNLFFRAKYVPIWHSAITDIATLGHSLGGKQEVYLEKNLKKYDSHWVLINLLWCNYLTSEINSTDSNLGFDDIINKFCPITYITRSELKKTLDFLTKEVRLVETPRVKGRPTYTIAEPFRPLIANFAERVTEELRKFLLSL
jgi:hypothetical protein